METLTVSQIKVELVINETELRAAIKAGMLQNIVTLKTQRDELKNLLIEVLESQLAKVA